MLVGQPSAPGSFPQGDCRQDASRARQGTQMDGRPACIFLMGLHPRSVC